jgi:hypothetical protein
MLFFIMAIFSSFFMFGRKGKRFDVRIVENDRLFNKIIMAVIYEV